MASKNPTRAPWHENSLPPREREFIPAEMSLERVAFFTPSSTSSSARLQSKRIDQPDLHVLLRAPQDIGLPITIDLDFYRAFQRILKESLDSGRTLREPIAVPTKRLLRYAGKSKGKNQALSVRRWLDRMSGVQLKATYRVGKDKQPLTIRGVVFDTILSPGEELAETGELAATNYIWLSHWYARSVAAGYIRVVDLDFHNSLRRPIAKSLYPLLQTGWFAARHQEQGYDKRYSHLCEAFVLNRFSALSRIKQQLEPAFRELQAAGFLAKWCFRPSKTLAGDWIISWWPGEKYLEDRRHLSERREIAERIRAERPQLPPLAPLDEELLVLVNDIMEVCKDKQSEGGYRKVVQTYPESIVRAALSETKLAAHQGTIRKTRGAYFMDSVKRLSDLRSR